MPKPLHECTFTAERLDSGHGHFVGVCAEWPDLHTKPYRSRLDAIDDIVDQVRDKLRAFHATQRDRDEVR